MAIDDDGRANAIAAEWGINVDLLDDAKWDVETIDGNDGELYGYYVRFSEDTEPGILRQLGLQPGEFVRQLSVNAFDSPEDDGYGGGGYGSGTYGGDSDTEGNEADNGIFSLNEPMPDISDFDFEEPPEPQRAARRSYNIDEARFTPSEFRRLSRTRKVQAMVQWFYDHYEDPANYVSYETREGGYQWGGHGPYDADEVIQEEFSDVADFDVMQEAVAEVTSGGLTEWAIVRRAFPDEDYNEVGEDQDFNQPVSAEGGTPFLATADGAGIVDDRGNRLVFGVDETALRKDVERSLQILDKAVEDFRDLVRRSHNNPPELLNDLPPVDTFIEQIVSAQTQTRVELASPTPDERNVQRQISIFRRLGKLLGGAVALFGTEVVLNAASDAIKGDYGIPLALYHALISVADSAQLWFQQLPSPF